MNFAFASVLTDEGMQIVSRHRPQDFGDDLLCLDAALPFLERMLQLAG